MSSLSEKIYKKEIEEFFRRKLDIFINKEDNPLKVGDQLASILKNSEDAIAQKVIQRAVKKWASKKTYPWWKKVIHNRIMASELRIIGRSIANSMRPLAGNNFTVWVSRILNAHFSGNRLPLQAVTSGAVKTKLSKGLTVKRKGKRGFKDYRPDIDIVLVRIDKGNKPVAIISAKTSLAERVTQTISWNRYLKKRKSKFSYLKLFLVTAWEGLEKGVNKERVQELDGVYVCNNGVKEYGNIKRFSKIAKSLKKLCD